MQKLQEHISNDEQVKQMLDEGWTQNVAAAGLAAGLAFGSPQGAEAKLQVPVVQTQNNIVAKVIAGEAASEGEKGMYAVACVIQNRAKHKSPTAVVTAPKQFCCLS